MIKAKVPVAIFWALVMGSVGVTPAAALTTKECSAKYQAAKSAGTLGGKTWNEFRKTECAAGAAATATEGAGKPTKEATPAKQETKAPSNAVFPTSVSPKYAKKSPGVARRHTCLDQYHANKATNSNGALKWIMKGGGYYSECNKRLKG